MNYILSKDQFENIKRIIADKTASKTLTYIDIVLYNIVRGMPAHRGFTPVTNHIKIDNLKKCYKTPWYAYNDCAAEGLMYKLKYSGDEYLSSMGILNLSRPTSWKDIANPSLDFITECTDNLLERIKLKEAILSKIVKYNGK